ncbi:MAG TPA: cation diffusion facilitator family transporter [Terrimicrobiaceae bacterium]|nr:cation diffusion facilitator family transporter [Terrimicrobiaceae bacterium]
MAHDHGSEGHSHSHAPADFGRAFLIGILLNAGFIGFEVVFGLMSDSLALLADAGHNLSDVLGLILAWVASELAKRTATERRTYGWKRATVLAALFNALLLLIGVGAIAWEAIQRFREPAPVAGETVIWVAGLGILVNGATALLFMSGRKNDLNVRGAFLHMAADAGVSAGVMISGAVILFTGWAWLDPVVSLLVAMFILMSTWELFTDSLNFSLDAVPENVDPAAVRAYLAGLPEVADVHHVHIWPLSTTEVALTAHLVKTDPVLDDALLERIREDLHHQFGIAHPTIQFEGPGRTCVEKD